VDLCDSEDLLPSSHLDVLLHNFTPALPAALPAAVHPNFAHKPVVMQALLTSERESTEAKDCTRAPWLDVMVMCVPNRRMKLTFHSSILLASYGLPVGHCLDASL